MPLLGLFVRANTLAGRAAAFLGLLVILAIAFTAIAIFAHESVWVIVAKAAITIGLVVAMVALARREQRASAPVVPNGE